MTFKQRFIATLLMSLCVSCVLAKAQLPTSELPDAFQSQDYEEGADIVADWCYSMLDSAAVAYTHYDIRSVEYWCNQAQKAIKDSISYYYHQSLRDALEMMKGHRLESNQEILNAVSYLEKAGSYRGSKALVMALCTYACFDMYHVRLRSIQTFKRMGALAQSIGNESMYIFSLIYQSQAFSICQMLPSSAQKAREALNICDEKPDVYRYERFFAEHCLAIIYSRLKSSEMAGRYFRRIEEEKVYEQNYYMKMTYLLNKCDHVMSLRNYKEAFTYSNQSLQLRELVDIPIYDWRVYIQRCKLETLVLRADESEYYAKKCEDLMETGKMFLRNDRYTPYCITLCRAHNYVINGQYQKATELLATIPYIPSLMHCLDFSDAYYVTYERAYLGLKNYRMASYVLNQHSLLADTVATAHARTREEDMRFLYKTDPTILRQQEEIAFQAEDAQRVRQQTLFWMLLSIFIAIIALLAFFYNKKRVQSMDARKAMELQVRLQDEVDSQTIELRRQNELISLHNADILRSQSYAKRIQQRLLPTQEKLLQPGWFSAALVIFKPFEITSGDFYWYVKLDKRIIMCAGDSASHGVPGAMVSMVALTLINDVVHRNGNDGTASFLLNEIYDRMINMMHNYNERNEVAITVGVYDIETKQLNIAAATQSVMYTHDNKVVPVDATMRMTADGEVSFGDVYCQLADGDNCFFYTEGLTSMTNGETNHHLKMSGLASIVQKSLDIPTADRHEFVRQELNIWKGNSVQSDDVLLLGITI